MLDFEKVARPAMKNKNYFIILTILFASFDQFSI